MIKLFPFIFSVLLFLHSYYFPQNRPFQCTIYLTKYYFFNRNSYLLHSVILYTRFVVPRFYNSEELLLISATSAKFYTPIQSTHLKAAVHFLQQQSVRSVSWTYSKFLLVQKWVCMQYITYKLSSNWTQAVSYTHLDVYKRQVLHSAPLWTLTFLL